MAIKWCECCRKSRPADEVAPAELAGRVEHLGPIQVTKNMCERCRVLLATGAPMSFSIGIERSPTGDLVRLVPRKAEITDLSAEALPDGSIQLDVTCNGHARRLISTDEGASWSQVAVI